MELQEIKKKIQTLNNDIARKEGELSAAMADLKRDFGIESLDEAYDKIDAIEIEMKDITSQKSKLEEEVTRKLKEYGY